MKITAIQLDVIPGQVEINFDKAEQWIRKAAEKETDVVVLPEMFVGGFLADIPIEELADPDGKRTKAFLSGLSKELNINIVGGSVATKKKDGYYNTAYVTNRQGEVVAEYDKTHLFSFAGEEKQYQAGESLTEFMLDGIKCGILICYELRFPELFRKQVLSGCELLFLPAEWPVKRIEHWRVLNQARAIENQVFMVSVNGCGKIGEKHQNGGNSMVIDPWGEILVDAGKIPEEKMIITEIEIEEIEKVRKRMTVFADRKPELY